MSRKILTDPFTRTPGVVGKANVFWLRHENKKAGRTSPALPYAQDTAYLSGIPQTEQYPEVVTHATQLIDFYGLKGFIF